MSKYVKNVCLKHISYLNVCCKTFGAIFKLIRAQKKGQKLPFLLKNCHFCSKNVFFAIFSPFNRHYFYHICFLDFPMCVKSFKVMKNSSWVLGKTFKCSKNLPKRPETAKTGQNWSKMCTIYFTFLS